MTSVVVLGAGLLGSVPVPADRPTPTQGAPGVHDALFPHLGNGGFDVQHYSLDFRYDADRREVSARTRISARATRALSRFDLDFDGNTVRSLSVDGRPAVHQRDGDELVITPGQPLFAGQVFTVTVAYSADPSAAHHCAPPNAPSASGWVPDEHGFVVAGQPGCARSVFPGSDHPSDKATYTIRITAPARLIAAANGELVSRVRRGDRTTWVFQERAPMATELTQIAVGDYTRIRATGPHGVRLRSLVPTEQADALRPAVLTVADHLGWMEQRAGRYPFHTYGLLVSPAHFQWALETQTLTLLPADLLRTLPESRWAPILVHELAHQWYGDSVAPSQWADVWLNEGHATWYEATYADERGYADLTDRMRTAYAYGDVWRARYGPVAAPAADNLFNANVYDGAAVVLYALREEVGARTFARIERAWTRVRRGGTGSTAQFIATASHVAHRDLGAFLSAWVYGARTPSMPGHPEWGVYQA